MLTLFTEGYKKILRDFRSGKILNRIASGKRVFFENPQKRSAFKYIPGEIGRLSKYYVKHCGYEEHEIDSGSGSILAAVMEGKPISKSRYEHFNKPEAVSLELTIFKTPVPGKAMSA